jgi:hypothetical protein
MGNYSKLIAALLGNVIAIVVVYLASKGLATCITVGVADSCTIFGFSTAQIVGAAQLLFSTVLVHYFPANTPPATT